MAVSPGWQPSIYLMQDVVFFSYSVGPPLFSCLETTCIVGTGQTCLNKQKSFSNSGQASGYYFNNWEEFDLQSIYILLQWIQIGIPWVLISDANFGISLVVVFYKFKIFHNVFGIEVSASQFPFKGWQKPFVFERNILKAWMPASGQITRESSLNGILPHTRDSQTCPADLQLDTSPHGRLTWEMIWFGPPEKRKHLDIDLLYNLGAISL